MRTWTDALLIGFTYIGTVVGAGFATGQEILQFFTQYGKLALAAILISSLLFIWLGTKLMMIAYRIKAKSYDDLNMNLFGPASGRLLGILMFILLIAITSVMLAGAGSVFQEHFNIGYSRGIGLTAIFVFLVMIRGMPGIKAVNSIVVPIMLVFMLIILLITLQTPSGNRFTLLESDLPAWRLWLSPFMYAAFNLSLAQAVLVPLGATASDETTIRLGGIIGGAGITIMLIAGHISLSAQMPGIAQFDIPMGHLIESLGTIIHLIFALLIYAEIFTTIVADIFGVSLQVRHYTGWNRHVTTAGLLVVCCLVSQLGFKPLLSTLYPMIGLISLVWLVMLAVNRGHRLR